MDLYLIHFPIPLKYVDPAVRYPPGWVYDPKVRSCQFLLHSFVIVSCPILFLLICVCFVKFIRVLPFYSSSLLACSTVLVLDTDQNL